MTFLAGEDAAGITWGDLASCSLIERTNRFVLRCRTDDGEELNAHLPNNARLREVLLPGTRLFLRPAASAARSTAWSAVLAETSTGLVSLDTMLPNRIVRLGLDRQILNEFAGWSLLKAEATIGDSRFDFLLGRGDNRLALEVKSISLVDGDVGLFPDGVSERARKHVRGLMRLAAKPAWSAAVLYIVQRGDVSHVRPANSIDPAYAQACCEASRAGVAFHARLLEISTSAVRLGHAVPVLAS